MGVGALRNQPCPCGSGRKWKACHEGIDLFPSRPDPPAPQGAKRAMQSIKGWTSLNVATGVRMPVEEILQRISQFDRSEALVTLSRIAGDLANGEGGLTGPAARAWTHNLLVKTRDSGHPLEQHIARCVEALPTDSVIVHGRVLFTLQALVLLHAATTGGRRPHDGELAFLILALNDHIPQWMEESPRLTRAETKLAMMAAESIFNHTFDDPLRFVVRSVDIMEGDIERASLNQEEWSRIQFEALGCSFREYAERFLLPFFFLSKGWGYDKAPGIDPAPWVKSRFGSMYERWLTEASRPIDESSWVSKSTCPGGLPRLSGEFFRTPLLRINTGQGHRLLGMSPWHVKDHVNLGTWGKLSEGTKTAFDTPSNEKFTATFGLLFERWCAAIARDAGQEGGFRGRIVVPEKGQEEIEDVVVVDGERVVLFSAKSTLIREASLKTARSLADVAAWHADFFFLTAARGKATGHRAGAAFLLDGTINRIREGRYESRGVPATGLIIPVIVSYDYIGEGLGLYEWLDEECARRGILGSRAGVQPLTVVAPATYEALMACAARKVGIADLLIEKTGPHSRAESTEWFLARKVPDARGFRLPRMEKRYQELTEAATARMKETFAEELL